jgi:hypothetical protein
MKAVFPLLMAASLGLSGCSEPQPVSDPPPTEAEIAAYLQTKAQSLQPDKPGLRLTDFTFSEDRRIVCGVQRVPDAEPEVFASPDATPATLERPFGLPYLAGSSTPETVRQARSRAANEDVCVRNGLMPRVAH